MSSQPYVALRQGQAETNHRDQDHVVLFDSEHQEVPPLYVGLDTARPAWSPIGKLPHFMPALEGLRGVAVVMTHIRHISQSVPSSEPYTRFNGSGGVSMFFVLSGFLITGTLVQLQEKGKTQGRYSHLGRFYMARNVRLYPALLFMVIATMSIVAYWKSWALNRGDILRPVLALSYMTNLAYLFGLSGGMHLNCWSLAVEEQFYIGWSLALPWVTEKGPRARALMLGGLIFASLLLHMRVIPGPNWLTGTDSLFVHVWKMVVGACLRLLPLPRFLYSRHMAYIGLVFIATLVFSPLTDVTRAIVSPVAQLLAVGVAVSIIMASVGEGAENTPLLSWKASRFAGRISYGWYLWQLPMLKITAYAERHRQHPAFLAVSATSVAFLAAVVSTFLVEEPIRTWYRSRQRQKA